jgi:hypothetical protein
MLHNYIPNYVEPTSEEIAQHQAENAARLAEIEKRNQRVTDILTRLGGLKPMDLDERYNVAYSIDCFQPKISIQGEDSDDYVGLSPSAALKLLAWLEQERAILEELAKEQGV